MGQPNLRGCDQQARQKKQVESSKGGIWHARATVDGRAELVKSIMNSVAWSECKIDEKKRGVPTQPRSRKGCCERRKELSRAISHHATERGPGPRSRLPGD